MLSLKWVWGLEDLTWQLWWPPWGERTGPRPWCRSGSLARPGNPLSSCQRPLQGKETRPCSPKSESQCLVLTHVQTYNTFLSSWYYGATQAQVCTCIFVPAALCGGNHRRVTFTSKLTEWMLTVWSCVARLALEPKWGSEPRAVVEAPALLHLGGALTHQLATAACRLVARGTALAVVNRRLAAFHALPPRAGHADSLLEAQLLTAWVEVEDGMRGFKVGEKKMDNVMKCSSVSFVPIFIQLTCPKPKR